MGSVRDDLVVYHALTKLLGELHCNVTVLEEKTVRFLGEGELALGHCFEKEDGKSPDEAAIAGRIGADHQRAKEVIEVPVFMKDRKANEKLYGAFERGKDPVRRQEMNHEGEHGWTQVWRDIRQIGDD